MKTNKDPISKLFKQLDTSKVYCYNFGKYIAIDRCNEINKKGYHVCERCSKNNKLLKL